MNLTCSVKFDFFGEKFEPHACYPVDAVSLCVG